MTLEPSHGSLPMASTPSPTCLPHPPGEQAPQQVSSACSSTSCRPQDLASTFEAFLTVPWLRHEGLGGRILPLTSRRCGCDCARRHPQQVPPQGARAHQLLGHACMAGRPPGLRTEGAAGRTGRCGGSPEPRTRHTPSAHSPRSRPGCRASGPGGTGKLAVWPRHQQGSRAGARAVAEPRSSCPQPLGGRTAMLWHAHPAGGLGGSRLRDSPCG